MFNIEFKYGRTNETVPDMQTLQRTIDEQRLRALAKGTLRVLNTRTGFTEVAEEYYCLSDQPPRTYTQYEAQERMGI